LGVGPFKGLNNIKLLRFSTHTKGAYILLRNLDIQEEYITGEADLIDQFYKPCLKSAVKYDRSVGFFRSSVYILVGPEIIKFAQKGGKIRLICSPSLTEHDLDAISEGYEERKDLEDALSRDIDYILANAEIAKNTEALATLIKCGILEVKIAFLPEAKGEYHAKLGIFWDSENDAVSFKGSVNESWTGWHERGNHETLDVFCSWKLGRDHRQVERNATYFERLWTDKIPKLKVVPFPRVCREKLEAAAKNDIDEINSQELVDFFKLGQKTAKDVEQGIAVKEKRSPLPHQLEAIEAWRAQYCRGIFEHATGSGKTFTALTALKEHLGVDGIALVLVPDRLLHKQWAEEIKEEIKDVTLLKAGNGFNSWRQNKRLNKFTRPVAGAGKRVVLATMPTARIEDFRNGIFGGEHLMVVADEVHEIGSKENSLALEIKSGKRLGLSATPKRYSDPIGTQRILDYFGPIVQPPFTLIDAIEQGRLVKYEYHPEPIRLTAEESDDWEVATKEISQEYARSKRDDNGKPIASIRLQNMLIQRSRIAKKASAKVPYAIKVIKENYTEGESWLVYCEDQYQLNEVMDGLTKEGYSPCEYHTSMKGDPAASLDWFKKFGGIMVSIRCLDQGVDIPKISHAIILASSQNPRQFIQRRGRVLRTCKGKYLAVIYDAVVVPINLELEPGQLSLLKSELQRSIQFSQTAVNKSGANKLISIAIELGVDPEEVGLIETDGVEDLGVDDE
jgi:superfamily II DNA or RNA helicase